jgi:hypothetical protein
MTQEQHDLLARILDKIEMRRRRPTGGYDRRYGATVKFTRDECDELDAIFFELKRKKKPYVFRPYGHDEGEVAFLTEAQAKRIQERIDALTDDDLYPPFYIYDMEPSTFEGLNAILTHEVGSSDE